MDPHWDKIKIELGDIYQRVLNLIKIADNYKNIRKDFLFKTKRCKVFNCKQINCAFAHSLEELRPQNSRLQKAYRRSAEQLELAILPVERYQELVEYYLSFTLLQYI